MRVTLIWLAILFGAYKVVGLFGIEWFFVGAIVLTAIPWWMRRQWGGGAWGEHAVATVILKELAESFPILLLVFVFRSFAYEPFRIPSGSLEPTLRIGDFILVNKWNYGLRLPVTHQKIWPHHEPKRGEILVFRYPPNEKVDYIKRVIGLPGDVVAYKNKVLYLNNHPVPQKLLAEVFNPEAVGGELEPIALKREALPSHSHLIYLRPEVSAQDMPPTVVPLHQYFVLGDNRDNSADSRYWGFVPEDHIIGQAVRVWMSIDLNHGRVRWDRIWQSIH